VKRKGTSLDRILTALNHPVRRRIMRELAEGEHSASTLSRKFEMELGIVSYHLNQVLAKQCKVIELVDTVPRRGSIEKVYGLRDGGSSELPAAGEPGSAEEMAWTIALAQRLFDDSS
jgi:DNA-binding transcriptional ArsR family regulator